MRDDLGVALFFVVAGEVVVFIMFIRLIAYEHCPYPPDCAPPTPTEIIRTNSNNLSKVWRFEYGLSLGLNLTLKPLNGRWQECFTVGTGFFASQPGQDFPSLKIVNRAIARPRGDWLFMTQILAPCFRLFRAQVPIIG